jgi:hypothetical protein
MYSKHAFNLLCYKWHSMSQRLKKLGVHNLVVRRIFSDILLVLRLKKVEKHCPIRCSDQAKD